MNHKNPGFELQKLMPEIRAKICGFTNLEDPLLAANS